MARFVKFAGGDEEDGLTPSKCFYHWRPGARKALKRSYNRRERKALRRDNLDGW